MKHILLIGNIDGHSIPLLHYAGKFCKDLNLKLHILQIEPNRDPVFLSSPYYFNKLGFMSSQGTLEKKKQLESFVTSNIKSTIDTDWVSFNVMRGDVQTSIEKFINEEKIDLLIVRKAVFNNFNVEEHEVFSKLFMNVSKLPMLIIPDNQLYEPLKSLVYFTTFSDDDLSNIDWISNNFKEASIRLIHFSYKDNSGREKKWINYIKSEIDKASISYKRLDDTIENFINTETNAAKLKYDCLALTTHKRSFWQRFINPSTTLNLFAGIEVPALIFKYKEV
jgi:hypothetical protein